MDPVTTGVPVLTWRMVFEQLIIERLLTEVLGTGEGLWPTGPGARSTRYQENEVVPAKVVARALLAFMSPRGVADAARGRAMGLASKAREAMAGGGSSACDLHRLLNDLMEARGGQ